MKIKTYIFLSVLVGGILGMIYNIDAKGRPAGTIITNIATVQYTGAIVTNTNLKQVMAIYGTTPVLGATNSSTYPGGITSIVYSITNNGNTSLDYTITLNNFISNIGDSVSNWTAYISLMPSQIITGLTNQSVSYINTLNAGASVSFTLFVQTHTSAQPLDEARIPLVISATGTGLNASYIGDNGVSYGGFGGTNVNIIYPRIAIDAPFISLTKVKAISNMPGYTGDPNIPVPDTVITYTNYYVNTGSADATSFIIIDTIPSHTDFLDANNDGVLNIGDIKSMLHAGSINIVYNISTKRIRFEFDTDVPPGGSGWVSYKVRVHRRRQ